LGLKVKKKSTVAGTRGIYAKNVGFWSPVSMAGSLLATLGHAFARFINLAITFWMKDLTRQLLKSVPTAIAHLNP
jgi:hypothetical protein